ncbi:MAG: tRNA pseudouridine(13) synthase TruD [Deltaproteobacteria bacterium]|nr:tRNA pseudouridine(13) synthase TruD [Deltaproteobacteria bacterium]
MFPSSLYLTCEIPGTGGSLKVAPEDFRVEEIPAYGPTGQGDHVLVTVEKRDLSTFEAVRRVAAALGVKDRDIGTAGLKDRHAVTVQQISLPPPVTPERARSLDLPGLRVLSAERHPHKLKTGHLKGNRFVLVIRGVLPKPDVAAERARLVLDRLRQPPGVPNWYGEQRFGARGDNAERGRSLVRGERPIPPPRDNKEKRLLFSAFQSELFNRYLTARMTDGLLSRVITGDVLRKVASGGIFATDDPTVDQPRLDSGEIVPTGPMFGVSMRAPKEGTDAARREASILADEQLQPADFSTVGALGEGTRRPLAVSLDGVSVKEIEGDAIEITFRLPPGAYATVVAAEVVKPGLSLG